MLRREVLRGWEGSKTGAPADQLILSSWDKWDNMCIYIYIYLYIYIYIYEHINGICIYIYINITRLWFGSVDIDSTLLSDISS